MPLNRFHPLRGTAWLVLLLGLATPLAGAAARADATGRWQRVDAFLQQATTAPGHLGAVALVEHNGRITVQGSWGHQDLGRGLPMRQDSIFRIYSMTKPVTSVAVLMLLEEGRLTLDDPVALHLPAFANQQQVIGGSAQAPQLAPLAQSLTLRHLLTHTSGMAVDAGQHPAATAALLQADLDNAPSLAEVAARLACTPLADAPGTHFHYEGANTDLLARVVEVVSGQPFAEFLQQRIFTPLGMVDTGFEVPAAQRQRVVDLPTSSADGSLVLADSASARAPGTRLKAYDNGAGGLYSTAADYLRFARMLLGHGQHGQPPLLSRKTRQLMMADQLAAGFGAPIAGFSRGEGFGLGGYVVTDPAVRGRLGSVGQFGWSGAASTYFSVDPAEQLIAILLLQYVPGDAPGRLPTLSTPFYNLVYQAID